MHSSSSPVIVCVILSLCLLSFINAFPASHFNALEPRKRLHVDDDSSSSSDHTSSEDSTSSTSGTNTGSTSSGSTLTGSGTSSSSPYLFAYSGGYVAGSIRSQCRFPDGKCYLKDQNTGNGMTCQGSGTWYTVTASNISAACAQFKYTSSQYGQAQNWTQTTTNDGKPLLNSTGGPMTITWTTQFDEAENATPAACEGALGDLVTACGATNGSSQGGLFNFPSNTAAYGVYFY